MKNLAIFTSPIVLCFVLWGRGLLAFADIPSEPELKAVEFPRYSQGPSIEFAKLGYQTGIIGTEYANNQAEVIDALYIEDYWGRGFSFPVFGSPSEEDFVAWIKNGLFVTEITTQRFDIAALPEVGYEVNSFIVYDYRPDTGWLSFGYKLLDEPRLKLGWTLEDYLKQSSKPLRYIRWEDYYARREVYPLFDNERFIGVYTNPSVDSELVAKFKSSDDLGTLSNLGIEGDWMKVRFYDVECGPCYAQECNASKAREGWLRWRNESTGERLIGSFTRGC